MGYDTNPKLSETIVFKHENKKLHEYIGDLLSKHYKKCKPKKQIIWSTDISRATFIIMKNGEWIIDKKGLNLIKYVIRPTLKLVTELMQVFVKRCSEKIEDYIDKGINNETYLKSMVSANDVIKLISLHILEKNIAKHMGAILQFKKISPEIKYNVKDDEHNIKKDNIINKTKKKNVDINIKLNVYNDDSYNSDNSNISSDLSSDNGSDDSESDAS